MNQDKIDKNLNEYRKAYVLQMRKADAMQSEADNAKEAAKGLNLLIAALEQLLQEEKE